jgi:DNA-directed RNA polymerase specialized sigma24 family protein
MGRYDEEHLRRFLTARGAGDETAARHWWDELVIDFHDRMEGLVAVAHGGRLDPDEHELAHQLAMIRFAQNLIHTFEGTSLGQLVNATKQLARYACIDAQRRAIAERGLVAASLDEGESGGRQALLARWEHRAAEHAHDDAEAGRDALAFLAWALPRIPEPQRRVLQLTAAGAELDAICAELGISGANAYQRRSRGLKALARLREEYDG